MLFAINDYLSQPTGLLCASLLFKVLISIILLSQITNCHIELLQLTMSIITLYQIIKLVSTATLGDLKLASEIRWSNKSDACK